MTAPTPQLSLQERRYVRASPSYRWPCSPRAIQSETLASYCIRLGALYGLTPTDVLGQLGIPRSVAYDVLEREPSGLLAERLASTTGRPYQLFESLRLDTHEACLPFSERTGFCPHCWMDRRCAQAAYLDRHWALPYILTCRRHEGRLLHEWSRVDAWPELFVNRSAWRQLTLQPLPEVWHSVCGSLRLDPLDEWQQTRLLVRDYEQGMQAVTHGTSISDELRIVSDVVTYMQIQWDPLRRLPELGAPTFSIHEQAFCYERFVRGTLKARLHALIGARHVLLPLQSVDGVSELSKKLLADVRTRKKTHLESWWLRRRMLRWPSARRAQGQEMFGLSKLDEGEIAPFDSCRTCARAASATSRNWLYVNLSDGFRCEYDQCG